MRMHYRGLRTPVYFTKNLSHVLVDDSSLLPLEFAAHLNAINVALFGDKGETRIRIKDGAVARGVDRDKVGELTPGEWLPSLS
jgi:hypothetical protein